MKKLPDYLAISEKIGELPPPLLEWCAALSLTQLAIVNYKIDSRSRNIDV
jgi:hypothetical protein